MSKCSIQKLIQASLSANIEFCRRMAATQLISQNVWAFRAELVDPILNVVMHATLNRHDVDRYIALVIDFYERQGVDWYWIVGPLSTPHSLVQSLMPHGFAVEQEYPSLYFDLNQSIPTVGVPSLQIVEQAIDGLLDDWAICISESFHTLDQAESYRRLNQQRASSSNHALRHFVGYLDSEPVCAGTLFVHAGVATIHNLATRPRYRRMKFASVITTFLLQQAKSAGLSYCFLDSAEELVELYLMLGFKELARSQLCSPKKILNQSLR